MSRGSRILGGIGLLAGLCGITVAMMMPPPVRTQAMGYVEEHRLALRSYLPEVPPLTDLITGAPGSPDPCETDPKLWAGTRMDDGCAPRADSYRFQRTRRSDRFRGPLSQDEPEAEEKALLTE